MTRLSVVMLAGLLLPAASAALAPAPCAGDVLECHAPTWGRVESTSSLAYDSARVASDGATVFVLASGWAGGRAMGTLRAYDAATGASRWSAVLGALDGTALVAAGGRVVVAGESDGRAALRALDAATGAPLWTATAEGAAARGAAFGSLAPSPGRELLLAAGSARAPESATGLVVAYDAATGAEAWRFETAPRYHDWARATIVAAPATSFAVVTSHLRTDVLALDPATGALRAATPVVFPDGKVAAIVEGTLVVASASWAVGVRDGSIAWTRQLPGLSEVRAAVGAQERAFVSGYGPAGYHTLALDGATGALAWTRGYAGRFGFCTYLTGLATDGDSVFVTGYSFGVGAEDLVTIAYDAATGASRWSARQDSGRSDLFPAIVAEGGRVTIAASMDGGNDALGVFAYTA